MKSISVGRKIKRVMLQSLQAGAKILVPAFSRPKKISYKSRANLVTETDRAIERKIAAIIRRSFPDHAILGEEAENVKPGGFVKSDPLPYKWIIDPIDGTTNFAHALPAVSISIGLERYGKIIMGGVWNPLVNELFFAELGKGAYLNGKRIHVSQTPKLTSSLLVTGFPYDKSRYAHQRIMKIVQDFLLASHGIRRLGSAALDLCYVACGRFDGYWESKLQPWDQAAGALIAAEAGATLTNFSGKTFSLYEQETLCSNGRIHAAMLKVLKRL